ncbi:MAG: TonB C-terminal domain-containing protein [Bdellovibrionales bacterium]|nr:TonB C-terminal domain-containing protein [Bdellovibrionales bacterium]
MNQHDPLSRFLVFSFIFHIFVLASFTIKSLIFPQEEIVVRDVIRVDMVDLPDKIVLDQAKSHFAPDKSPSKQKLETDKVPPKLAENKVSIKDSGKDSKKFKTTQERAMEKLEALKSIDKLAQEMSEKTATESSPPPKVFKGNILSPGESLKGLDALDHNQYFGTLKVQVQKHFILPQWLAESSFKAKALVKIDERGYVISRELIAPSGEESFDVRVIAAIDQASPFPPPPPRLVNIVAVEGMTFNFPN